jgi:hypothetical protein
MDNRTLQTVVENKNEFTPHLFTSRQISIMENYLKKKALNNTEKAYLYSTIKNKIAALTLLKEEFYITGQEMIPRRVDEAKKILKEINKEKAFISGSFLYNNEYNDIDIYIISNKRKSYHKGKNHFTFITENDLQKPIFFSSLKYSVANFSVNVKPDIKRKEIGEVLFTYQWVINQILDKEDQKELRGLIFEYNLQAKGKILDSYSLHMSFIDTKKLIKEEEIEKVNQITKELLLKTHSKKYIYNVITKFSKDIKKMKEEYDTENIPILLDFAREVKNECRKAET